MRHRVEVRQLSTDPNAYGEPEEVESVVYGDVPASIEYLTGRNFFAANEHVAEATHRITMRYHPNIDATMRIYFGARRFDIVAPVNNPQERNRSMQWLVKERGP